LSKAREYIAGIQPSLRRLAELEAEPKQVATPPTTPAKAESTNPTIPQTLEERYRARIAAAEAEVEKAKGAVLEAPSPAAQTLAMRELRMKEQRLNYERRNFR